MERTFFADALGTREYSITEVGLRGVVCERNNNAGEAFSEGLHRQ